MPRDLPIGNGIIHISFDMDYQLREFYFPYVGQESHTKGEPFRFGVWVNGQFSWVPDGWSLEKNYLDDSLVTNVVLSKDDLTIVANDLVDFEENLYLKKFTIENRSDEPKEIRLFLAQDFHIYGNEIGDTAEFRPENETVLHYKGERYFLINIYANKKFGIDSYSMGTKETAQFVGTWKDAEDGILSMNPIAQGSVDSVIGIPLTIGPHETETCYYWISAGKNWEEVRSLNERVKKTTPEAILKRTFDYWKFWSHKEALKTELIPEKIARLYYRSLLICRTQINNCGSIIAGNDSSVVSFNRDTYSYMWPRDGSLIANALDLAGYSNTSNFYRFCAGIVEKEGYFLHRYSPSGALASSWHPWIKDKKEQLPIQEDETALVIWALWGHYERFRNVELIRSLYEPFVKKCADFMMNYRDFKTGLPLPSYDLWEERQGVLTFTVSTVFGGLMAAANFAEAFGEKELAQDYRNGAQKIREAMDQYLYLENEKRFARMINFKKDGTTEIDASVDASLYAAFAFGPYEPTDEKVKNTMEQIIEKLSSGGGISRYDQDPYYRSGDQNNPWFITTLWVGQYYIAIGKLDVALEILEWVADHALPSGVLAEQVNPVTHEPLSVSPLTWSHGTFIATVQQYINKKSET